LNETVGCQDQIAAAYGGLNRIDFMPGGEFRVTPICLNPTRREELEENLMMFFTGFTRSAEEIEQKKIAKFKDRTGELRAMYDMVDQAQQILVDTTRNLSDFGDLLHESWVKKRSLDEAVSNSVIDASYEAARRAGAIGGKLLGAGGGGFLLLYVPRDRQAAVRSALRTLPYVPLSMERNGTSVVLYNPELTSNYVNSSAQVS
jgi:D-glycero-alpha-D-manno-heptose-7-phosphate kinase